MLFDSFRIVRKSLTFMFLQTVHVLSDFQVGNFSINLCRSNVAVSEHLAERFHCYTIGKADGRGESMASHVVNTSLSKRKRNIGGNMVTGCELVVFLCSATDRDRQNSMEY